MTERRTLSYVIVGLAVVAVGLTVVWWRRDSSPSSTTTTNTASAQVTDEVRRVAAFADVQPQRPRDERIVLFGDSLTTSNTATVERRVKEAFGQTPELITTNQGTSILALTGLIPVVESPPRVLIVDITRYDGANDITMDHTLANLALIKQKADQIGTTFVVVLGPSSDNNLKHAAALKAGISSDILTIDATDLMMTTRYRESLQVLNEAGMGELGGRLIETLKPLLTT